MKNIYFLIIGLCLFGFIRLPAQDFFDVQLVHEQSKMVASNEKSLVKALKNKAPFRWPWRANRMNYLTWWTKKVGLRITESFDFRTGVRYFRQKSRLEYIADQTIFGGRIVLDEDLLNSVNLPSAIENRLKNIEIELPTGKLSRDVQNWTSLARVQLTLAGVSLRGRYWSGTLAPKQFPQPKDVSLLFNSEDLVSIAASEVAGTSALNNAISLELSIHPIQLLTGFRKLEWSSSNGFYVGGDFSFGWMKSTDLTFKQGRELLGDIDMGQEIRDVIPDPLEALINTDEAGEILLVAAESRIPLYGFGLPVATGRIFEIGGWMGFQWSNPTWSGDARLSFTYQTQRLVNDHPSTPVLTVRRWTPTVNVKWVFNKGKTESSLFGS